MAGEESGRREFARPGTGIGVALFLLVAIALANTVGLGFGPRFDPGRATGMWVLSAALIVLFMILVGWGINRRFAGLIIDNRNRVSLSKFQAACWTVLVLSALATYAGLRARFSTMPPLDIAIPTNLLIAMGISATSLVATPALLSLKAEGPAAAPEKVAQVDTNTGTPADQGEATGQLYGRKSATCAQWLDMFRGEEVSNADAPDLSKVQQFLVTLLLVGTYAGAIINAFLARGQANTLLAAQTALPALDGNFIWLMGISHASYLAYKAAPHGPSTPATPAQ